MVKKKDSIKMNHEKRRNELMNGKLSIYIKKEIFNNNEFSKLIKYNNNEIIKYKEKEKKKKYYLTINKEKVQKQIYQKNILNFLLIYIIFMILFPIYMAKNRIGRTVYEISMTFGNGSNVYIIGTRNMPDKVMINDEEKEPAFFYSLERTINNITISYNEQPKCKNMFSSLTSVKTIDLSNFDSSGITDMSGMFAYTIKLTSINFGNFDTSSVTNMEGMFHYSWRLTSLNLSNFNTRKVTNMKEMFYEMNALISLDLSSFDTSSVTNMENMFNECPSLIYVNLISFVEKDDNIIITDIFRPHHLIYCLNPINAPNIYSELQRYHFENDCENTCFKETRKIIIEELKCVENCGLERKFSIEKNDICMENPQFNKITEKVDYEEKESVKTSEISENSIDTDKSENNESSKNTENSENNQSSESTENSENNQSSESTENDINNRSSETSENLINDSTAIFSSEQFFKDSHQTSNEESSNKDETIRHLKEDIKKGNLDSLLSDLINGTSGDLIAEYKDITYQITTTDNQNKGIYNKISSINLGICEDNLKRIYNIDKNLSLIILKIDYKMPGLLIPVIGYEVYDPINKTQLNLSYCNDTTIKLNIPVTIDEDKEYKYDPTSDYYNDECYAYTTENGTDIILNDRKNEYNEQNLSLCENNCTFNGYNSETKKALCECETKIKINLISDILAEENILSNTFNETKESSTNVGALKCVSLLFSKNGLIKNIGSYILFFTIGLFAISTIIFYKCGYQLIVNNIHDILSKKNINNLGTRNKNKKNTKSKKKKKQSKRNLVNPNKKQKKINNKKPHLSSKLFDQNIISYSKTNLKHTNAILSNEKHKMQINTSYKAKNISHSSKIKLKETELNHLIYKEALIYDKRTFMGYYCCLNKIKVPILFAFYPVDDYNIRIIKICLFFLSFVICFSINTFFFNDSTFHQIYLDGGKYNFPYFLPKIILSFFLSHCINILLKYFCLSEKNFLEIKNGKNEDEISIKADSVKRCLIIKYIIFFISSFIFLIVFWYYLSSFCAVYQNTQIYLIINTTFSFLISIIYPLFYNIIPSLIRISSFKGNNNEFLFKISMLLQEL